MPVLPPALSWLWQRCVGTGERKQDATGQHVGAVGPCFVSHCFVVRDHDDRPGGRNGLDQFTNGLSRMGAGRSESNGSLAILVRSFRGTSLPVKHHVHVDGVAADQLVQGVEYSFALGGGFRVWPAVVGDAVAVDDDRSTSSRQHPSGAVDRISRCTRRQSQRATGHTRAGRRLRFRFASRHRLVNLLSCRVENAQRSINRHGQLPAGGRRVLQGGNEVCGAVIH
jgi:hypothetical protein